MSFLAPLFIIGAAAVSLPILFHLIRRSPRGRMPFSSLMFLRPSPPRITRRSRLENWLLLILRASALCLLALAFARPFLRGAENPDLAGVQGETIAILMDTSASMGRDDLWPKAVARAGVVIDGAGPGDRIVLFTFDDRVRTWIGMDEWTEAPIRQRAALLGSRLKEIMPTFGATDLGGALAAVADILDSSDDTRSSDEDALPERALRIVLITDLQRGSRLEGLDAYAWPDKVRLTVERVSLPRTSNAGLSLLEDGSASDGKEDLRVRVANEAYSDQDRFTLGWVGPGHPRPDQGKTDVHVPPGESRVVLMARPSADFQAERLALEGDDHGFDNTLHVAPPRREEATVLFVGAEEADDTGGLRYYAERALTTGGGGEVRFVAHAPGEPLTRDGAHSPRLIIVTGEAGKTLREELLSYARSGGTVLFVAKNPEDTKSLGPLLGCETLEAEEADTGDYIMLSDIDFTHPLLAPLAAPRFNDFTKIRFWHIRRVRWDTTRHPEIRVIARFDNGDPALFEKVEGSGRILGLSTGWHPEDSQLALSTKFVPIMAGFLEIHPEAIGDRARYYINDSIPIPRTGVDTDRRTVQKPDGTRINLAGTSESFSDTDQPGIYVLERSGVERSIAVNLSPRESRTAPMAVEDLERHGVRLGAPPTGITDRRRRMLDLEIESTQKVWKWMVAVVLGILILETWLAGRTVRRITEKVAMP